MLQRLIIIILIFICVSFVQAADWSSCAYDLDRLRRAARDASDAAEQVDSAKDEFESKKDELEDCLNFPDVYDLMVDGCQSMRWDYESALSNYKYEISNLKNELNTVENRIQSVQWSCGYEFSVRSVAGQSEVKGENICNLYRSYVSRLPMITLLEICKKSMTEEECKKCLEIK